MASNISSSNSTQNRQLCICGSGWCIVKTSRSSANPGRCYFKCPSPKPFDNWNGWCDKSLPTNTSFQPSNEMRVVPLDVPTAIPSLSADIADLRAETREILNSLRTLKTVLIAMTVVIVLLVLLMKFD